MEQRALRFLLTSDHPAAVTWRATAPAEEWAAKLVEYRRRQRGGVVRLLDPKERGNHGEEEDDEESGSDS